MNRKLKPAATAVALVVSVVPVATTTQPGRQAGTVAPKSRIPAEAQVESVAKETHLTDTQVRNARTIVSVVEARKLPRRAAVIAVATAMQESKLRNVHYGDRDSLGLFQQRPSTGWGTDAQVLDPQHATRRFLDALQRVPNWRTLPVTKAAQDVQRSAFPKAYARWAPLAKKLVNAILPRPKTPRTPSAPADSSYPVPRPGCVRQARKRLISTRP
jgi:hypothetical protein